VRTIGIAIDIPEPWGGVLTRRRAVAGDRQAASVRAHLTLLRPTMVAADRLEEIDRHLVGVAATHPPFALHLRGTGTFRPVTEVVFVAVAAGIGECERLATAIGVHGAIGGDRTFPYHPHVTVAQDVAAEQLDAVFADLAGFEARFLVAAFTLFEHDGGRWLARREYLLAGTGTGAGAGAGADGGAGADADGSSAGQ
jgi:2'-5' RNA ligase